MIPAGTVPEYTLSMTPAGNPPVTEERMIDLETRLAHQDQALALLNDAVIRQQDLLTKLERLYAALAERVAAVDAALGDGRGREEPPPHY
jgi:SlyX protein